MGLNETTYTERKNFLDRPLLNHFEITWETLIFSLILIAALLTRFYDLGARVMSHDENSHVYFSWLLSRGQGYAHDPVTHGPFQFHIVALTYFILGDSDFTARIPVALFNIAAIAFLWAFRRYLGKFGALAGALMLLISPFILYYGRYVRNESFVGLYFVVTIWSILRYLETGRSRYMYWMVLAMVMHYVTKETSFIYIAQALLFFGLYFVYRITQQEWLDRNAISRFLLSLMLAILLFAGAAGTRMLWKVPNFEPTTAGEVAPPTQQAQAISTILVIASVATAVLAIYFLVKGYGWKRLRNERAFSLMVVLGTLILPHLSAFVINFAGWKIPVNATQVEALTLTDILHMAIVIIPIFVISIVIGLAWNPREWLINAGIFYAIFTVLYTTFFTNGAGFFTGLVGSLGYWLAQQTVYRGSQPWYYYIGLQIPIYEFLPALGAIVAVIVRMLKGSSVPEAEVRDVDDQVDLQNKIEPAPTFGLLAFWSLTSIAAYTFAGEKMPWLTYHITLPMILLSAWGINRIIEQVDWAAFKKKRGWLILLLLPVLITSAAATFASLLGANPPFQGKSLAHLSATSTFLTSLGSLLATGIVLSYLLKDWLTGQVLRLFSLAFFGLLAILTARAAFRAAYVNYDDATEFLVYAHSAPGVKIALSQIEDISRRLTGGLEMVVAYDNDTTYPYWWYLRNFPNQRFYGANPTRDLRDAPVILVGDTNYAKIEPIVGQAYEQFDYIRIWWPNQDYYDLTWARIWNALKDPQMRSAIFAIWYNRDYAPYARKTGKDMSLQNWYPSGRMRLYIRKDIAAKLWDYGSAPTTEPVLADPYEGKQINLPADKSIGTQGQLPGQFQNPRNVAIAPDGSLYVADSGNHRIQHFTPSGEVLETWGSFADVTKGPAPGGTFNEPWGIAVGPDGSVYVADTWNHRVQKFTAKGDFITMWGTFGQAESPTAFWGPRGIAVDAQNRVFVTDTGNKRVVVFDATGGFITEFGLQGTLPGEFSEPVGLALAPDGTVYVADTWNQRIQVFAPDSSGTFQPKTNWEIVGWYGQSLDNKPFLTIDSRNGHVYVSDPEGFRILEFTGDGQFVRYWGDYGQNLDGFNLPIGIAFDHENGLWVADSGNHRLLHFTPPGESK